MTQLRMDLQPGNPCATWSQSVDMWSRESFHMVDEACEASGLSLDAFTLILSWPVTMPQFNAASISMVIPRP